MDIVRVTENYEGGFMLSPLYPSSSKYALPASELEAGLQPRFM